MSTFKDSRKTAGFTLGEVLTVLVIVGMLATILIPVFQRAGDHSRRTECISKLKMIGLASLQYTQDWDMNVTPATMSYGAYSTIGWPSLLKPYLGSLIRDNGSSVLFCPSDESILPIPNVSYSFNGFVAGNYTLRDQQGNFLEPTHNYGQLLHPEQVILTGDSSHYTWSDNFDSIADSWVNASNINGSDLNYVGEDVACQHNGAGYTDACVLWAKEWVLEDHYNESCLTVYGPPHVTSAACNGPDYRHERKPNSHGIMNAIYLDGHTQSLRYGSVNSWNVLPNETPAQKAL